jgi:hypothetical protein
MRLLRRAASTLRWAWPPLLALGTVVVLFSITPPGGPGCPSVWSAAQYRGHGMGTRFYDCRTWGEQRDATIQWMYLGLVLGVCLLFGGYALEALLHYRNRSYEARDETA